MTKIARLVLDDCKNALSDFTDGLQGSDWRRQWVLCVTLLRVVGHALEYEKKADENLKGIVDKEFKKLKTTEPKPHIYWNFIHEIRNSILKEYNMMAGQGLTVFLGSSRPTEYIYTINDGYFKGRNQKEVIQEAIDWWEDHLAEIEKQLST